MKLQRIAQVALAFLVLQACSSPSPDVEQFGFSDLESQRVSGEQFVRVVGISDGSHADVSVVVDVDGRVIDAEVDEVHGIRGLRSLLAKGAVLTAAKDWRFKPATFEGRQVQAVGRISIAVRPGILSRPDKTGTGSRRFAKSMQVETGKVACPGFVGAN